jgi:Protein phosphatase 2C
LITDGAPTDSWQNAAYRIRQAEGDRRMLFFAVALLLSEKEASKLFTETVNRVTSAFQEQAANDGYSVDDLACTLLVVVATPDWVTAMQIVDGFIVVRDRQSVYKFYIANVGKYI